MVGENRVVAECDFCEEDILEGDEMLESDAYGTHVFICRNCYTYLNKEEILEELGFEKKVAEVDWDGEF